MKDAFAMLMEKKEKKVVDGYQILKGHAQNPKLIYPLLQFDGGSEPNPGPSTGGAVLFKPDSKNIIFEVGEYVEHSTNNQAEYYGLWLGLQKCIELGFTEVLIEGDSQLVIKQVSGEWKIKDPTLQQLHKVVSKLIQDNFDFVGIKHVLREYNTHADALTNEVMKTKESLFREKN